MFNVLLPVIFAAAAAEQYCDAVTKQVTDFKKKEKAPIGILTTSAGAPVHYNDAKSTLNTNLIDNEYFIENLMSVLRERIPERVVHATGNGAFGYFESTHDISHICKAKLFEFGKKTPVVVRFSLGFSLGGVSDTTRDIKGFAVKFYTEEGNFDLAGFNIPIFAFRDPIHFSHISHASTRNPATNLLDPNMLWDFLIQQPENIFIFLYFFSDHVTPYSFRHMPCYGIHTFEVYNKEGKKSFVRMHLQPNAGIKHLNSTEISKITCDDPDFYTRDLYNAISKSEYPSWQFSMQILSQQDVDNADFDVFDVTKELPLDQYPLHPVGKLVLNENPTNHFAQIEQLAFCPGNLVPGILGSPDQVFRARRIAYKSAQLYRLGSNFNKIPVNCPLKAFTYLRDGVPPVGDNSKAAPSYYPNSFYGPIPCEDHNRPSPSKIYEKQPDNFKQAGTFYCKLSTRERISLVDNIVKSMCSCEKFIKERAIKWFKIIHPDLALRVSKVLVTKNCSKNC